MVEALTSCRMGRDATGLFIPGIIVANSVPEGRCWPICRSADTGGADRQIFGTGASWSTNEDTDLDWQWRRVVSELSSYTTRTRTIPGLPQAQT